MLVEVNVSGLLLENRRRDQGDLHLLGFDLGLWVPVWSPRGYATVRLTSIPTTKSNFVNLHPTSVYGYYCVPLVSVCSMSTCGHPLISHAGHSPVQDNAVAVTILK